MCSGLEVLIVFMLGFLSCAVMFLICGACSLMRLIIKIGEDILKDMQ